MNRTPRSIALIAGLAASAAVLVPGVAAAGDVLACAGKTVKATANHQVLQGTGCNDTFEIGRYAHVTVKAGDGNDTVYAGFNGNFGMNYLYLGNGQDKVINSHDKAVWVDAGAGNDVLEGSSGYDAFYGGSGTDTAEVTVGDFYDSIETFS